MRAPGFVRMLLGSVAIYVVVAACSATNPSRSTTIATDGGMAHQPMGMDVAVMEAEATAQDVSTMDVAKDAISSIVDVLTDPIPNADADLTQSGTRLKAVYYAGSDGSQIAAGYFHDSMRNEDCSFALAADGMTRCLPIMIANATVDYADSACTQPLLQVQQQGTGSGLMCQVPPYAFTYVTPVPLPAGCPGAVGLQTNPPAHIFPVTTKYAGNIYYMTPSGCQAVPDLSADDDYSLGPEISPTSFVAATVKTAP